MAVENVLNEAARGAGSRTIAEEIPRVVAKETRRALGPREDELAALVRTAVGFRDRRNAERPRDAERRGRRGMTSERFAPRNRDHAHGITDVQLGWGTAFARPRRGP